MAKRPCTYSDGTIVWLLGSFANRVSRLDDQDDSLIRTALQATLTVVMRVMMTMMSTDRYLLSHFTVVIPMYK